VSPARDSHCRQMPWANIIEMAQEVTIQSATEAILDQQTPAAQSYWPTTDDALKRSSKPQNNNLTGRVDTPLLSSIRGCGRTFDKNFVIQF
jgi:hypothetical protein